MNTELLEYYKLIGKINNTIRNASSVNEALQQGLRLVTNTIKADISVLWYRDDTEENVMYPNFWQGNIDLTHVKRVVGKGCVGKVYDTQQSIWQAEYTKGTDSEMEGHLGTAVISSMMCVPFGDKDDKKGCIQLLNTSEQFFTEEQFDLVEIMSMLIATVVDDCFESQDKWKFKETVLKLQNLEKSYPNGDEILKVLKGITLEIFKGEFLVILGESGCGKSTLLNIIGGLLSADSGSLVYDGVNLVNAGQKELTAYRKNNVGFVFQSYNLMPNLTVQQNIDFIGELIDDPLSSIDLLEKVHLRERADYYPSQLSGGQQQRVSIARALVKHPSLIMADEPTAALDYSTSIEVLKLLKEICEGNTTLIMVTHNEEIAKMADRIVRLRDGKISEITINRKPSKAEDLVW